MTLGQRIERRADALGISQSELARRVGVGSTTINGLIRGNARWSPHLFKIARVLLTSAEFLAGEIDDPDEGVPPTPERPAVQSLMLPVTLPSEIALAAAYKGLLMASRRMDEDELARELAKRLPTLLRVAADSFPDLGSAEHAEPDVPAPVHDDAPVSRRRA